MHMFLFTDFIMSEDIKFAVGFSDVTFIGVFLVFNLGLVLFYGFNDLKLLYIKHSRLFIHKFFPEPTVETELV